MPDSKSPKMTLTITVVVEGGEVRTAVTGPESVARQSLARFLSIAHPIPSPADTPVFQISGSGPYHVAAHGQCLTNGGSYPGRVWARAYCDPTIDPTAPEYAAPPSDAVSTFPDPITGFWSFEQSRVRPATRSSVARTTVRFWSGTTSAAAPPSIPLRRHPSTGIPRQAPNSARIPHKWAQPSRPPEQGCSSRVSVARLPDWVRFPCAGTDRTGVPMRTPSVQSCISCECRHNIICWSSSRPIRWSCRVAWPPRCRSSGQGEGPALESPNRSK
jgi:hypothetical protein